MATKPEPDDIRFVVDVHPNQYDSKVLEAVVYPVIMEEGKIRNCQWSYIGDRGSEYADFKITARLFDKNDSQTDFFYGHNPLEYSEIFSLDLHRAESVVKTLRRVTKKIDALKAKWGDPADFAQYLGYLAVAVANSSGQVFAIRESGSGQGWSYDDSKYRWLDVNSLRYHFRTEISKWKGVDR